MSEFNRELLFDELLNFEKRKYATEIPEILNKYLEAVAKNGDTIFPWNKLQPLVRRKLEIVMNEFNERCPAYDLTPLPNVRPFDYDELKSQILESIDAFPAAPFTIQRLCELITNPSKHYKRTDKFMRGIEKNILVVSTIEPSSSFCNDSSFVTNASYKELFSSLHSTTNSTNSQLMSSNLNSISNGILDNNCDTHNNNEHTDEDKCHTNKFTATSISSFSRLNQNSESPSQSSDSSAMRQTQTSLSQTNTSLNQQLNSHSECTHSQSPRKECELQSYPECQTSQLSQSIISPSSSPLESAAQVVSQSIDAIDSSVKHLNPLLQSEPSNELAPLQQLDSFTAVFASTPSTPLSVVSDLQSYDESSDKN